MTQRPTTQKRRVCERASAYIDYDDNENRRITHNKVPAMMMMLMMMMTTRCTYGSLAKQRRATSKKKDGKNFRKRKFIYADSLYFLVLPSAVHRFVFPFYLARELSIYLQVHRLQHITDYQLHSPKLSTEFHIKLIFSYMPRDII